MNAGIAKGTRKPKSSLRFAQPELGGVARLKVRHILVPTDFSPLARKALRYARPLAKRFRAQITLLHVVKPRTYDADYGYGPVTRCILDHAAFRAARRRLVSLARSKSQRVYPTNPLVCSGSAPEEIVNVARRLKTDLIVIGESSASQIESNPTLLTTAEKTLRQTLCPVIVVRKNGAELLKTRKESL